MSLVLSLGSVNADALATVDVELTGPGTYPGSQVLRTSGGKAANVAVLAQRLGVPAKLIAVVGDDDLASTALRGPEAEGVDLGGVATRSGATGSALILVPPSGDKTIVRVPGANDRWDGAHDAAVAVVREAPAGTIVVVDLEITPGVVRDVVRAARERELCVVLDPAPPELVDDELLGLAHHVVPDHREATAMTGIDATTVEGAARAAQALHERGASTAYVKLAEGGCAVCGPDGGFVVHPAAGVDVVDATGAGDAFAGGLAYALACGMDGRAATETAVAASTCAVTKLGSQESYPSRAALDDMRERIRAANAGGS